MGMEYELIKEKNGERYDLGKGMWSNVFNTKKAVHFRMKNIFSSYTGLYYKLLETIAWEFEDDLTLEFFKLMASDIVVWCGEDDVAFYDTEMVYDYLHSKNQSRKDFEKKFPVTGTRYGLKKKIVRDPAPKNWYRFHHADCGSVFMGCHPTKCPKNVYELTGKWIGPKFEPNSMKYL